jgi:hypothetical protein
MDEITLDDEKASTQIRTNWSIQTTALFKSSSMFCIKDNCNESP